MKITAQGYVITLLFVIFFLRFFTDDLGVLGRIIALSIEGFSLLTIALVLLQLARGASLSVSSKYVKLFVLFVASSLMGACANGVQPGAVFSGIRNVFLYMPFFLIPLIFVFSSKEISNQLKLLVVFAIIQIPIAVSQYSRGMQGGTWDHVQGTLMISSYLSLYLIGCVAITWSYYLAGRIDLTRLICLVLLFLIPTTMNETKGTFLLLPFAFLGPSFVKAMHEKNYKMLVYTVLFVLGMGLLFLGAFSLLLGDELTAFFLEGEFLGYLYSEIDEDTPRDWGVYNEVGRIDAILFALKYILKDPIHFFFGYGIGNVSESFLDLTLGDFPKYQHLGPPISTMSLMLWELGMIGISLIITGCVFILKDAYNLARTRSYLAPLAAGWVGVVAVYLLTLPYKNILISDVNGILFWYFSGLIVAERVRQSSPAAIQVTVRE